MNNQYNENKGTFKIDQPDTGKDWSNHFFNDMSYIMSVTHFGGTFSRYVNDKAIQVTLNCPNSNYVYIRDEQTKKYWNITQYPSLAPVKNYYCLHGQQYTEICSKYMGIAGKIVYAIAPHDTREVWQVTLSNRSGRKRELSVFGGTVFELNGYPQPVYYSAATTSATEYVPEVNAIFNELNNPYKPHTLSSGYILSSEPVAAYDGNFEKFVGVMGSFTKPKTLEKGMDCSNSLATVRQRAGILQNRIVLEVGETKEVYFCLGLTHNKQMLIDQAATFISQAPDIIKDAKRGESRFGKLRTHCPDPQFNRIFNFWTEHQVSYCMLGKKAVRDNAQLGMAMLNFNPILAKKTIDECVMHQYSDGHSVLTWYPFLEPNIYSDPSVWLILAVCEFIKETGEVSYLEQKTEYLDGGQDSVLNHLIRALDWLEAPQNYGANGLPLLHHADWNDALNIPDEGAESVFMAMAIALACEELVLLAKFIGNQELENRAANRKQILADVVNRVAFNGDYYVRAFSKYGTVGDKNCDGGKIYVNPQSWAILADVVPKERIKSVLNAIDGMETDEGVPLCAPPYTAYDPHVGRMSGMLPGVYENGGVYNHAGCFKIMADCKLGRNEHAYKTLSKIIPDGTFNPSSVTSAEPYVFTNCYLKHPTVDMQVGFSWQTGTSAWGLMCYYEGILGLRRSYEGLLIKPCLPSIWKNLTAERHYRGNRLIFTYLNNGGNHVQLEIDGKPIEGNLIKPFADKKMHKIKVILN